MSCAHRLAVVIPSYPPHAHLVGEAIQSVLAQTVPVQLLVNHGVQDCGWKLNAIVAASDAEFVTPLGADDLLDPTYAETCLNFAESADLIYTDRRHFTGDKGFEVVMHRQQPRTEKGYAYAQQLSPRSFLFGSPLPATIMVRRTLWDELRGWDATLPHADTEFLYRAVCSGARIVYVPLPLFLYRNHEVQLSKLVPSMTPALVAFHRKHFRDFGFMFDDPEEHADNPAKWDVAICPPTEREAYIRAHFLAHQCDPISPWAITERLLTLAAA